MVKYYFGDKTFSNCFELKSNLFWVLLVSLLKFYSAPLKQRVFALFRTFFTCGKSHVTLQIEYAVMHFPPQITGIIFTLSAHPSWVCSRWQTWITALRTSVDPTWLSSRLAGHWYLHSLNLKHPSCLSAILPSGRILFQTSILWLMTFGQYSMRIQ